VHACGKDVRFRLWWEPKTRKLDGPTLAYALHARHLAVWAPDNLKERVSLSAEIIQLAQRAGDVTLEITGHVWQLADLLEKGDIPKAERVIDAHETLARRVGYPHFIAHSFMFRATQAMLRSAFADAEALAQRSLALGEQVGDVNVRISHQVAMSVLRALQGRHREAAAYFEPMGREHPPTLAKLVNLAFFDSAENRTDIKEAFPERSPCWPPTLKPPTRERLSTTLFARTNGAGSGRGETPSLR